MTDDAELRIVVDDQMSTALKRIEANVKRFGTVVGAEAGAVNKAMTDVNKTMGTLGASGKGTAAIRTNTRAIQEARAELIRYNNEVKRLSNASTVTPQANGTLRGANGKFISAADVTAYNNALKGVADTEERLVRIRASQPMAQMKAAQPVGYSTYVAQQAAAAAAASKKIADAAEISRNAKWFPPEMLKSASAFTTAMSEASNATRYIMYDISRNVGIAGVAMAAFGTASIVAAASFEKSFAAVSRTVQGTDQELNGIYDQLVEMSQTIPVTFSQLSEIASVGAQMGIGASGIAQYTETIAKLTATTNLTADAAGKALGRFKAFFAEADDPSLAVTDANFTNLASSILKVGVNSVATESGIVGVATQISSMGSYAGFTADQVVGLAGALSSVGVPPELSRGVITRLFNTMSEAVSAGGSRLADFAGIAGVSSAEFQAAWGTDRFAYIFTDFIAGLQGMTKNGGDAVATLHELGITSVRDVPVLLRLAGAADNAGRAGGLLAQTMNDARSGWRDNIELTLQYSKISQTLSARFQVLIQNFTAMFAAIGQGSLGPMKFFVDGLIAMVQGITDMVNTPLGSFVATLAVGFSIFTGALLLTVSALAAVGGASIGATKGLVAMGIPLEATTGLVRGLSIALAASGVIAALVAIGGAIVGFSAASAQAVNPVQDMAGALKALQTDTEAGSGFDFFVARASSAGVAAKETSRQTDNLGKVLNSTKDEAYGISSGLNAAGDASEYAALKFGKASTAFLRSQISQSSSFQDLFKSENSGFADLLARGGFDLDKFNKIMASKGRDAGAAYLEGITGAAPTKGLSGTPYAGFIDALGLAGTSDLEAKLLDIGEAGVKTMKNVANAARVAGDGMIHFTDATQIAGAEMDAFEVQNEESINKMAEGYKRFVDSSSLIGFTQQFKVAQATMDDLSTDTDEHAAALADYEKAWQDAYGGASFSLAEYMGQFRKAGDEQTKFTENIQTLFARGVDPKIIGDLAAMGPQAAQLVQALVNSTDAELDEYVALYQKTGFDSMVGLAAGQLAAQQIVTNAAKTLSSAQLQQLSADLIAGTPLVDAMAKWQLDASGKPIDIPTKAKMDWYTEQRALQQQAAKLGFNIPITPYLTKTHIAVSAAPAGYSNGGGAYGINMVPYASGGYTGDGGKYDPAGVVHRGEFVLPQSSVRAIGLSNLYGMLRNTKGSTPAYRGGYATGGSVTGGMGDMVTVQLSAYDRQLLADAGNISLNIDGRKVADASNAANFVSSQRGSS